MRSMSCSARSAEKVSAYPAEKAAPYLDLAPMIRRLLDGRNDVADAGQVKHVLCSGKDFRAGLQAANILPMTGEVGVARLMREVAAMAAGEVVDDADRKAAVQQKVDEVAADEAGAPGHDGDGLPAHAACSLFRRRTLK